MPGVEILASAQVATEFIHNYWLATLVWIGIIIFTGAFAFLVADYDKWQMGILGSAIGALIGIIVFVGTISATAKPVAYETQYKVTIEESVSMTDFYEHYEVIDQEGKIFTVMERE
jgi:hypothetical protein